MDGFIKIERQDTNGVWSDVTLEILNLGIAGRNLSRGALHTVDTTICSALGEPNPNAVIRLQRLKDVPASGAMSGTVRCGNGSTTVTDYWPNVLYDAREGLRRDAEATGQNNPYLGGVMHYVELDVNNLRRWLAGSIGASGPGAMNVTGYVVYFSDRRLNREPARPGDRRVRLRGLRQHRLGEHAQRHAGHVRQRRERHCGSFCGGHERQRRRRGLRRRSAGGRGIRPRRWT